MRAVSRTGFIKLPFTSTGAGKKRIGRILKDGKEVVTQNEGGLLFGQFPAKGNRQLETNCGVGVIPRKKRKPQEGMEKREDSEARHAPFTPRIPHSLRIDKLPTRRGKILKQTRQLEDPNSPTQGQKKKDLGKLGKGPGDRREE